MHMRKGLRGLPGVLGALGLVLVVMAGVAWWASGGRFGAAADAGRVVRPADVPECGLAWRVAEAPDPSKVYDELHAMAAASPGLIWAAGTTGTEEFALTLIERWDGTAWSHVHSPSVEGYSNHLYGVSALNEKDAWVVGASHQGTDLWRTLALRWDGGQWQVVPSRNVGPISALNAVVALAEVNAWAVGESSTGSKGSGSRPLIEHWDGKAWTIVPVAGVQAGTLNAVSALSRDDIWAAGSSLDASGTLEKPLLVHWDGKAWENVPVEDGLQGTIWGLAAVSAGDVWAVGNNGPQALALRWDGSGWKPAPAPNPSKQGNVLNGIATNGPDDIWAAGSQAIDGADRPLAAHWDGKAWTVAPSPSVGDYQDVLNAVVAFPSREAWAAGSTIADTQGTSRVLVQRFSDPCTK
jgi:hypothetical protein